MRDTTFLPPASLKDRIAPSDLQGSELRWGDVHDPLAYRMGGVAGQAGVFTTADDLTKFAQMMLGGGKGVLKPASVAAMTTPQSPPGGAALRGLGWDIDSPYAVWFAPSFSTRSYGHTGYTGTAIWIDPETKTFLIVLTNRLHPDGKGNILPMLRRIAEVAGAASRGQQAHVLSGIDVLEAYGFRELAGRRVGLITNRSARDSAGRRTVDVLHQAPGPKLVALFSPEHGLDASAEGKIASSRDSATGLPIHSLYGSTMRPTASMLAGLDALVFDMQDVGTRYYTYPTTMAYAMEAAAQNQLDFFVLDRPDPITAATVQGPVLDADLTSFITYMPLPVRYGMTIGELARLFNAEKNIGAKLHVITMRRYQRSMWFDQTGFAWVAPSPNLRKLEQAVLYPGVGMAEAANISVGRGTDSPFELVGAPWIDGKALADQLNARRIAGRAHRARDLHAQPMGLSRPELRRHPHHPHRPQPFQLAPVRHRADRGALSPVWRPLPDRPDGQHDRLAGLARRDQGADRPARHRPLLDTRPRRLPRAAGQVSAVLTAARIEASSSQ